MGYELLSARDYPFINMSESDSSHRLNKSTLLGDKAKWGIRRTLLGKYKEERKIARWLNVLNLKTYHYATFDNNFFWFPNFLKLIFFS